MNTLNRTQLSLALLGTPNTGITLTYITAQMCEDDLETKFREGDYDFEYDDLIESGFHKQANEYMHMKIEELCIPHQVIVGHSEDVKGEDLIDTYCKSDSLRDMLDYEFNTENVYFEIECSSRKDLKVEKVFFAQSVEDEYFGDILEISMCDETLPGLVA